MTISSVDLVWALTNPDHMVRKFWNDFLFRVGQAALKLPCPVCPAIPGQPCIDAGMPVHREREESTALYQSEISACERCGKWHSLTPEFARCWKT